MPNILITDYCNRSCPYCFATEKISSKDAHENTNISIKNVDQILSFLEKSQHNVFSVLGGEPSQHPQFTEILDMALDRNFKVRVFSNGLMTRKKQKYLFRNNVNVIVNINEPSLTPEEQRLQLERFYEIAGPNIYPGFNIYREGFDFTFLFDLINRYHLPREIRLGISQPIVNGNNACVPSNKYRAIGEKIVEHAKLASQENIRVNFDCGFTMCMFSKKDFSELVYANTHFHFTCRPTIDIGPDLKVWYCFPLSSLDNTNLQDFDNLQEILNYYEKIKNDSSNLGIFKKCNKCLFFQRHQCQGGCISHKLFEKNRQTQ